MNISLPPPMQNYVKEAVERGHYGTVSEYIRHLIRQDQKNDAQLKLEQALISAMESSESEDSHFFENLRKEIKNLTHES